MDAEIQLPLLQKFNISQIRPLQYDFLQPQLQFKDMLILMILSYFFSMQIFWLNPL